MVQAALVARLNPDQAVLSQIQAPELSVYIAVDILSEQANEGRLIEFEFA
jgi:hypothetical protein